MANGRLTPRFERTGGRPVCNSQRQRPPAAQADQRYAEVPSAATPVGGNRG